MAWHIIGVRDVSGSLQCVVSAATLAAVVIFKHKREYRAKKKTCDWDWKIHANSNLEVVSALLLRYATEYWSNVYVYGEKHAMVSVIAHALRVAHTDIRMQVTWEEYSCQKSSLCSIY